MDQTSKDTIQTTQQHYNLKFSCTLCNQPFNALQKLEYHEVACAANNLQSYKHVTRSKTRTIIGSSKTTVSGLSNQSSRKISYETADSMYMFRIHLGMLCSGEKMPVPTYRTSKKVGPKTWTFDNILNKKKKKKRRLTTDTNFTTISDVIKYQAKILATMNSQIILKFTYTSIPKNKFSSFQVDELEDIIEECTNTERKTRLIHLKKAKCELELSFKIKEEPSTRVKDILECPFCEMIASHKESFDHHTLLHYPLECAFCYKSFKNENFLQKHYELYHKFSENSIDSDLIINHIKRPIARILSRRNYVIKSPNILKHNSLFGIKGGEGDLQKKSLPDIRPNYQGLRYDSLVSFEKFPKENGINQLINFERLNEETVFLPSFSRMFCAT